MLNTQRNLNERAKISHFGLLLRDCAKTWFSQFEILDPPPADADQPPALLPNQVNTFAAIREQFIARFARPEDARWQDVNALYDFKQEITATTEFYVTEMLRKGEAANATQEQIRFAILHGLRDSVKNFVLQHNHNEIQEIVRWGQLGERIADKSSAEISSALERLEKMMSKIQVTSMGATAEADEP